MIKRFILDFETRSECNLKKAGAYVYSCHPTTRPTCLAFMVSGSKTVHLMKFDEINQPWEYHDIAFQRLWKMNIDQGALYCAHNSGFDFSIYKNILVKRYGWPDIPFRQWRCTAAKAAACALPRNLEGAGAALNLTTQKDKRGYAAMLATCKPTKRWNAWDKAMKELVAGKKIGPKKLKLTTSPEPPKFLTPEADPKTWETLYTYCKIDVATEELLDRTLPDLISQEQEVWFLNQQINWRGIRVDIPTIEKIVSIMKMETVEKLEELDELTLGLVTKPGARQSILEFLKLEGVELPDIKAKTVEDALNGRGLGATAQRLLEIRRALSKTSTKKYEAFLARALHGARIRDLQLYHGASTGRDTGTGGPQIQNLAKRLIPQKEVEYVLSLLEKAAPEELPEIASWIQFLYGDLGMVFSSLLRSMFIASEGCELFVSDLSKIEVAVLWWLADNLPGLEVLLSGKDPYIYQAAANLGVAYEDIPLDGPERQLAKAQILGAGFGIGWMKFQSAALDSYRLKLTDEQSKNAVRNYRETNAAVPEIWRKYELAAIEAVKNKKKVFTTGKCRFFYKDKFLWIELPSGRRLAYREPQISWRVREYEVQETHPVTGVKTRVKKFSEPKETLEFWAVNPKTKKWALERTWGGSLTENITQAAARDLLIPKMVDLEKAGYRALMSVHDEVVCERKIGGGSMEEFNAILCTKPSWADEWLPLEAKGFTGFRYRK